MREYEALWQPAQIGPVSLRNRVVVTPHALAYGRDNLMTQQSVDYYEERAKGGAGLILTEAQVVHPSSRGMMLRTLQSWPTEVIPVYERLADALHRHGARVFVDLSHFGAEDNNTMHLDNWRALWSASGLPSATYGEIPRPMSKEDIAELVAGFGRSARNAAVAGMDGAEIHAAHGYLLCSFLSPLTNLRTDEYGGSTENRCRIVLDCARSVRANTDSSSFAVGVRLSLNEFVTGGIEPDEGERILRTLDASGLFDYFSISGGSATTFHRTVSPMSISGTPLVGLAARVKSIVDKPIITANGIADLATANGIVERGDADLVAMTRAHIADPHLIAKAQSGREDEIRHCVAANQGCFSRMAKGWSLTCTQNPAAGREAELGLGTLEQAAEPRTIVVVGGGPAGMRAAETASARGHRVVLFERGDQLGGQIRYAAQLPTRGRWAAVVSDMERTLAKFKVDVRLGTAATVETVSAENPYHVVMATGSSWRTDGFVAALGNTGGIPGLEHTVTLDPITAIEEPDRTGQRVLIIDDTGEYLALGLAEKLAADGRDVEVVTTRMFLGDNTLLNLDLAHLYPRLHAAGVVLSPQHAVVQVTPDGAVLVRIWDGQQRVARVDSIVTVAMRAPEESLAGELRGRFPLTQIGDCSAPRRVDEAIYEGELAGRRV
ncbi:oxidoreductase [Amycolatopsis pithecellobii]|uniref:FAD-dependent oxidoreductase n=1 Tax=Amycolatopsis pithecellobii TaxID=664692 RepID=A0A6N7YLS3_9PSEU|nr:FAD-dependent oxidoreductase [Amycolatopsis pithecellobii]MTD52982.1 FAD-dependent oxidoreductase [Amycolatopsis pithecellobii]